MHIHIVPETDAELAELRRMVNRIVNTLEPVMWPDWVRCIVECLDDIEKGQGIASRSQEGLFVIVHSKRSVTI